MSTPDQKARHHLVARTLHWTMLLAILAQFLLGYGIDRADDLFEFAIEQWFAGEEDVLVLLHVGLVLKHQLIDRDGLLHRML